MMMNMLTRRTKLQLRDCDIEVTKEGNVFELAINDKIVDEQLSIVLKQQEYNELLTIMQDLL